ncbi:MAG: nucleotidyltransferase family protein [Microbacterium sp.]
MTSAAATNRAHPSDVLASRREQVKELVRQHKGRAVYVFGSVARGEATLDSDIDLLVEFEPGTSLFDLAALQLALVDLLGVDVDVISTGGLNEYHGSIVRDARTL